MKYELTNETKLCMGKTLYRIKALKSFNGINIGDLGGFIEKSENLSQSDNAWVFGNARVYDDARVYGNAEVSSNARVYGDAMAYGNAEVYGDAEVYGNAKVTGDAEVSGNTVLRGFDTVDNTNQVMNLIGFEYNITVTYSSIHIGCKDYYIGELDSIFSDDEYQDNTDIPLIKAMVDIALEKILKDI